MVSTSTEVFGSSRFTINDLLTSSSTTKKIKNDLTNCFAKFENTIKSKFLIKTLN